MAGQRLICITACCPDEHRSDQRDNLGKVHYIKSPQGKGTPAMFSPTS